MKISLLIVTLCLTAILPAQGRFMEEGDRGYEGRFRWVRGTTSNGFEMDLGAGYSYRAILDFDFGYSVVNFEGDVNRMLLMPGMGVNLIRLTGWQTAPAGLQVFGRYVNEKNRLPRVSPNYRYSDGFETGGVLDIKAVSSISYRLFIALGYSIYQYAFNHEDQTYQDTMITISVPVIFPVGLDGFLIMEPQFRQSTSEYRDNTTTIGLILRFVFAN
jgi:hypothetical protein